MKPRTAFVRLLFVGAALTVSTPSLAADPVPSAASAPTDRLLWHEVRLDSGGAQGLALLSEYGVDHPWDCPHCRDPLNPKTPLYTHLGHTDRRPCGDYSACEFERGVCCVRQIGRDPVFAGLPQDFPVMESHCGQIQWPPTGWELVATAGPGAKTKTQCLRLKDGCIYAAQFHIEMAGTTETSRQIAANFLALAKRWGQPSN